MRLVLFILAAVVVLQATAMSAPNNPYGAHILVQDQITSENVDKHLSWAQSLVGKGGYIKAFFYGIDKDTKGPDPAWSSLISNCYRRDLIPVVRLGGKFGDIGWRKPVPDAPGDYTSVAQAVKRVVEKFPRSDKYPLYIEIWNEPNLRVEWEPPNPMEYGQFYMACVKAIRSIGDKRIKIMIGALSPGGDYNNVKFAEELCKNIPGFIDSFDVWATHPYGEDISPEENIHDGKREMTPHGFDGYLAELEVLKKYGRKDVKIIATECGFGGASEDIQADLTMRAWRDYWSKWPEVLAICPYYLASPFDNNGWIPADAGLTEDKLPTKAKKVYWAVHNLAKPTDSTGCISGKVTENSFHGPLKEVKVTLEPGNVTTTTDTAGNYWFPRLAAGSYKVSVQKEFYAPGSGGTLKVTAGQNSVQDFSLETTSKVKISGTVTDSIGGQPLVGVKLTTDPGGFTASTDAKGNFVLVGLPPSTYTLSSEREGYYPFKTAPIVLAPDESKEINWCMGPGSFPAGKNFIPGELEGTGATVSEWTTTDGKDHPDIMMADTSVRFNGTSSQKFTPNGSENNYIWSISNYSAAVTGKRYRIEAWCKTEKPEGKVTIVGNLVSNALEPGVSFECNPVLTTSTGWTLLSGSAVAPEYGPQKQKAGRFQILLTAELKSGSAWFDTIWAGEDTTDGKSAVPPLNVTAQPGFMKVELKWTPAVDAPETIVVYREDRYPLSVEDGQTIAKATDKNTCLHSGIIGGNRCFYSLFTKKADGTISRPAFITAVPTQKQD